MSNPLEMSDEDFIKTNPVPSAKENNDNNASQETEEQNSTQAEEEVDKQEDKQDDQNSSDKANNDDSENNTESNESENQPDKDKQEQSDKSENKVEPKKDETSSSGSEKKPDSENDKKNNTQSQSEVKTPDYEGFYNQVMKPFKANNKDFQVKSPEEAIRLMQMGVGYGRKIQDLQPYIKTMRMLEKHNLLNENELSYLIDIHQKNPEAIKKLIKESGIDPLEINTEDKVNYIPTNRGISDTENNFHNALDEVKAHPQGIETINIINNTWDNVSKNALYNQPELLGVIQSQRENGLYDQITAEIDRQKTLGTIPLNKPFLEAYQIAGNYLVQQNQLKPVTPVETVTTPTVQQPVVIDTKPASVKSQVANNDKARAASPTQSSSRKAADFKNPLEMADDEFLKQFKGRL